MNKILASTSSSLSVPAVFNKEEGRDAIAEEGEDEAAKAVV